MATKKRVFIALVVLALTTMLAAAMASAVGKTVKEFAFLQACGNGNLSLARYLVESGVSPDYRDGWNGGCLFFSASGGHVDIAEFLLEKGVDVNTPYRMNKTALIVAAQAGRADMVRFLLSRGASPAAKDSDGKSALDHAMAEGGTEVIEALKLTSN